MQIHYLGRQIRRCQRNILFVCSVLLCALLLPFVVERRYFADYVAIILPGLALVLWVMARAAGRYRNLRSHPIVKKIACRRRDARRADS